MGRPSKLTHETHAQIVKVVRAGNYLEVAAAYAGISKQSLSVWMRRGAREARKGMETPYAEFSRAITEALAAAEIDDVLRIGQAALTQWQAAAWRLERKFPDRWGRWRLGAEAASGSADETAAAIRIAVAAMRATVPTIPPLSSQPAPAQS
jgi:hypothetical protein